VREQVRRQRVHAGAGGGAAGAGVVVAHLAARGRRRRRSRSDPAGRSSTQIVVGRASSARRRPGWKLEAGGADY
jgi:hypothetical protein